VVTHLEACAALAPGNPTTAFIEEAARLKDVPVGEITAEKLQQILTDVRRKVPERPELRIGSGVDAQYLEDLRGRTQLPTSPTKDAKDAEVDTYKEQLRTFLLVADQTYPPPHQLGALAYHLHRKIEEWENEQPANVGVLKARLSVAHQFFVTALNVRTSC
jgi:hypothetical protein